MVQVYYIPLSIFVCEMTDKMINHLNKPYFLSLFFFLLFIRLYILGQLLR